MKNSTTLFGAFKGCATQLFLVLFAFISTLNVWGQTAIQIGSGNTRSATVPITSNFGYSYSQQLYLASEYFAAGGNGLTLISKLRFYYNGDGSGTAAGSAVSTTTFDDWTVYIGNTTKTSFSSTSDWVPISSLSQSFSGTVTFPAPGNWMEITLTTPFSWDGSSNLIVAIDENKASFGTLVYWGAITSGVTSRSISYRSDTTNPIPSSPPTASSVVNNVPFIQFVASQLNPCSGAPTPGNTLASVNPVIGGSSTVLSLQNSTSGSGVTYQWQSSLDNSTWANISGATASTYSAAPTVATYYRCNVTCSGSTGTSSSLLVNLTYCSSGLHTGYGPDISNFTIGSLNNSSLYSGVSPGYVNYSPTGFNTTTLFRGSTYQANLSILLGSSGSTGAITSIWLDFNGNGIFEATEWYQPFTNATSGSINILVPLNAYIGTIGVRVRSRANGNTNGSGDACTSFASGETEDYTITIANPTCFPPTALTSSSISYQTSTIGWTPPTSGTSPGNYEYEIRTSGAAGSGVSGLVTSGTVATYSASITGLTGGTLYTYYVRSSCGSGDFSTWTSGTFTTTSCASLPSSVSSNTITSSSANISWTAATGSPAGYEYEVRTSGAAGSGSTGLVTTSTTTSPTVSASITGLSSNTTFSIYVRTVCYSGYTSAWTSASTFTTLKIEPTNQLSSLAVGTVSSTAIPLTWIAATGAQLPDGYLVKASSVSLASITDPVDGTDPADVTVFTANAANKKQTSGTATSTTSFTGMSAGTMYYYKVYSYTNSSTAIDFKTDNPATLNYATLPNNSSALSFAASPLNSSGATITWTAATGYDATKHTTLVFIKSGSTITLGTPNTDPSLYSANTSFTGSSTVYQGDNSAKCVYNGDGTSVIISSLTGSTTYYILILNVMQSPNSNGSYTYSSGAITSGTTFKIEPTNQLSSLAVGTVSSTAIPLTWIAATGAQLPDGYLVKASSVSLASITDPVDGTDPADVTVFTANAANKKQTSGTATSTTSFTGMSAGTMYYYKVYSYTNSSTAIDFKTDNPATLNYATLPNNSSALSFAASPLNSSGATITWTAATGYDATKHTTLVFIKSGSTITLGTPNTDPSLYSANTSFTGSSTVYQGDNSAKCVYNGDGTSVIISSLTGSTTYYILILNVMQSPNSNGSYTYSSGAITSGTTFKIEPTNQLSSLAVGTVSSTAIPLTWIAATGAQLPDGYLVKASSVSLASITDPVDGTDPADVTVFTANAANKKQTSGTATSTTSFTGMSAGTMYYYKVYSYTNSSTAIDFKTDNPATLNHATLPNAVSSTLSGESNSTSTINFSWSLPSGYSSSANEIIVFAKLGTSITLGSPTLGPGSYSASSTFGFGSNYEFDSNAFCVFKGDGTTLNLSGLSSSSTYSFLIFSVVQDVNSNGSYTYSVGTTFNKSTVCGAISTLPWTEGFELATTGTTVVGTSTCLPICWNSQSAQWSSTSSTTYNTAKTGSKYIRYAYSTTNAFIWTPGFQLTAGVSYDFSFFAQGDGWTGWNNDVFVNTSISSTGAIQLSPTYSPTGPGSTSIQSYIQVKRSFVPTTTGVYYFAIRGNQASGSPWYMAFDDFRLETTPTLTWLGITSNDWNTASNWSPAVLPTSTSPIIIPNGTPNSPTVGSLTINYGGSLILNSGAQLTISGTLTNNGTMTIESGATFIQGTSLAGSGTYNVKQTVTGAGGAGVAPTGRFWYMGVPLNNLTRGAAFGTAGTDNRLWSWSETSQAWSSQLPDNTVLAPTTGYVFRTGATSTTLNFSGTSLYSADASISGLTNTTGSFDGCHLMSNPYTAYLDWEAVIAAAGTTNLSSTYCVRSYNAGSNTMVYDTYNATGDVSVNPSGVAMTRYIAPLQAFWIIVNPSTTGSISMTKSMLSHQSGAVGLKDITSFPAFARLNLVSGDFYDQVVVYTDVNATAEFDDYDSKKFFLPNKAQVYCPVGENKAVINALKQGKAQTSAPLTVELPSTQVYKFEMAESFVENGLVILEDKQEGIFQDMGVNPVYEFYGNSGVIADRFVLHFHLPNGTNNGGQPGNGGEAGVEDLTSGQIAVIANHDGAVNVVLSADLTTSGDIQIFDEAGRLVAQKAITSAQTSLQLSNGMGVYFVRVQTPMKTEMKKVMVY